MYPGIAAAGLRLKADQAVVDGEIVALDAQGNPSFQALQHRGSHRGHRIRLLRLRCIAPRRDEHHRRAAAEARSAARTRGGGPGFWRQRSCPARSQRSSRRYAGSGSEAARAFLASLSLTKTKSRTRSYLSHGSEHEARRRTHPQGARHPAVGAARCCRRVRASHAGASLSRKSVGARSGEFPDDLPSDRLQHAQSLR